MYIGIDPDLHDLAVGIWMDGEPYGARVVHVPRRKGCVGQTAVLDMVERISQGIVGVGGLLVSGVAVEAQTLRRRGPKQHKRPEDIVVLGNVAGAALLAMKFAFPEARLLFPTPQGWKGSVPKAVHQARFYTDMGWGYEVMASGDYARPLTPPAALHHVTPAQWKHVGDALMLARWASQQGKK